MTVREDERLTAGAPPRPVRCGRCAARVLARKASWQQTSVQWTAAARAACPALAGDDLATCPSLRSAIEEAAVTGAIEVPGDTGEPGAPWTPDLDGAS